MLKKSRTTFTSLLGITTILLSSGAHAVTYPYLEDADPVVAPASPAGTPSIKKHLFPRTMLGDTHIAIGKTENRYAKYHVIATQASVIKAVSRIQKNYPDLMYFRMYTPRETQEYLNSGYCSQSKGLPFEGNASATGSCKVYPGHWLYRAGKKTTSYTSATATTIRVSNASDYTVGRYVVIYDAPVASFKNAEHAKITSKNASAGTITVQRGYKSKPVAHASGAIVAQHVIGQAGNNPENWAYNLSSKCPKDANGKTIGEYSALFLKNNIKKSWKAEVININVSGIMFDVDYHFELKSKLADTNNDLVTDHGVSPTGVNWYGDGMNAFYSKVRSYFPNLYIVGGTPRARGGGILSGIQLEGWAGGFEHATPNYGKIDSLISKYTYFMHNQSAPIHSNGLMKQGTKIHPSDGNSNPNSTFRLGLGTMLLEDGYFGQQTTTKVLDTWYDEFSVDVEANSPSYGQAVASNPYDESAAIRHRGWLGMPLGPRKRIYGTGFAASKSLISNATFDANLNSWSGNNVNVARVTSSTMDGSGALRSSRHVNYKSSVAGAIIKGPSPSLTLGKEYTLTFSAKAPVLREITAKVGSKGQSFLIGPKWRRYVMAFKAPKSGVQRVEFQVGLENSEVFLDTVHLFAGNANIFRRDFEKGIVIVNATQSSKTVSLGSTFQKILGTQDPSINNGSTVSSVTLAKYDAILLVRPENQEPAPAPAPVVPPTSSDQECGAPTYNAGATEAIYLWKDCAGDGSWHFRITGGGSTTSLLYSGSVTSSKGFTGVEGYSLESSDVLDASNPNKLIYELQAWKSGDDGVDFSVPLNSNACFNATTHSNVLLGAGAAAMSLPLDLGTLLNCSAGTGLQAGDECGAPAYDAKTDQGAFLWKDCGAADTWYLRVTAGGSSKAVKYTGAITSTDPISVTNYSIESSDIVNKSNTRNISFKMNVLGSGVDGVNFKVSNKGGCFNPTELSGGTLNVGALKKPVTTGIDLLTLGSCQ